MSSTVALPRLSARRSQAQRRDESQRSLVRATLAVVAERGVGAATFDEIGRAAGYSRGLATQKFGSKQGLIEAVIDYLHQQREAALEAAHVAEMSGLEAILHYIASHLASLEADTAGRAYFMLLAAAVADISALRQAFADEHDRVRDWLEQRVRQGQAAGEIRRDVDPYGAAMMVGSLLLGVSLQSLVDPDADLKPIRAASLAALGRSFAAAP